MYRPTGSRSIHYERELTSDWHCESNIAQYCGRGSGSLVKIRAITRTVNFLIRTSLELASAAGGRWRCCCRRAGAPLCVRRRGGRDGGRSNSGARPLAPVSIHVQHGEAAVSRNTDTPSHLSSPHSPRRPSSATSLSAVQPSHTIRARPRRFYSGRRLVSIACSLHLPTQSLIAWFVSWAGSPTTKCPF